jgi:hypothetical protein
MTFGDFEIVSGHYRHLFVPTLTLEGLLLLLLLLLRISFRVSFVVGETLQNSTAHTVLYCYQEPPWSNVKRQKPLYRG